MEVQVKSKTGEWFTLKYYNEISGKKVEEPLIFLDFDGVINSHKYNLITDHVQAEQLCGSSDAALLDDKAILLLNEIIEKTNAKVVLNTTWRYLFSVEQLASFLELRGFKGEIIGRTPAVANRENNIYNWMLTYYGPDEKDWVPFIALDDDWSEFPTLLNGKYIYTNPKFGLQREHVEKAVSLLVAP